MFEREHDRVFRQQVEDALLLPPLPYFDFDSAFDFNSIFNFFLPLSFRDGEDFAAVDAFDGGLGGGVEGAEGFEVVAEEFGADGEVVPRAPDIDDAAADRAVAFLLDLGEALVAEAGELVAEGGEGGADAVESGNGALPDLIGVASAGKGATRTAG